MQSLPVARLRNLGAVSARRLEAVGIATYDDLAAVGSVEAWRRVDEAFPADTSIVLLYALEGALLDARWDRLDPDVRTRLRAAVGRT